MSTWLLEIALRLDGLRRVPRDVLDGIVTRDGACMWLHLGVSPDRAEDHSTDRALAAWTCAGCPVQDECLELELSTAGKDTVGVWGALAEDDRRALYPHWLARGERIDDGEAR